ncbi:hypothetical protein JCM33374_g4805 [Metschnikowia sp. JCM 33374]|nr:hypothetical protein JCM33374_g4805 [Metschnikowia sp. JCM 33374]
MDSSLSDSMLVLLSVTSSATFYFVVKLVSTAQSRAPLLGAVFIFSSMISRTATFQGFVMRAFLSASLRRGRSGFLSSSPLSDTENTPQFTALADISRTELLEALVSLRDYAANSKGSNERRRRLFKLMSWRQQKLCDQAGYSDKVSLIDSHTDKNQRLFDAIVHATDSAYGLTYKHYDSLKSGQSVSQNTSSSNYRVIESLGHFVRDWSPEGEAEIAPMLRYITAQLDKIVSPENAEKTCVVIPGSGLGRVAHEVAKHGNYGAVHAVEFSGLMHACNRFLYEPCEAKDHKIYPHIHKTSNFLTTKAQFRETAIPAGLPQPENLHLHLDDFRYFSIPNKEKYDNVVLVSAFFIDTAQNILDYFDQINQLTAPSKKSSVKNGYWINFGPLKYGSAAQAELNASEIEHIRKNMGWVDHHRLNTIEDPNAEFSQSSVPGSGLSGYITDKQSLWQGYYGISMWASGHKSNQAQIRKK